VVAPEAGAEATLEIVSELLTQPRFESVFEAERQRMAVQAGRAGDSAAIQIASLFEGTLYGDEHPLGRRATAESVGSIELEDVRNFHASRYSSDGMVFAISGAVDRAQAESVLAAGFASLPDRTAMSADEPEFPAPTAPVGRTVVTREVDSRQGHVIIGHLGIEDIPEDHAALEVMNYVLSGGGFVSRMMKLLRTDTGITAALSGEVEPGRGTMNPYAWRFSGRPETLARGIRLALEQIQRMHDEGVTAEEFEGARTAYLDGLIPASYETSHRTALRLAQMELFRLYDYQSPQYLNYYAGDEEQAAAMRRLTIDDVNRAARKYLHPDNLIIAVAGPLDRIRAGATPEELELVRGR
jgi:zinc protease